MAQCCCRLWWILMTIGASHFLVLETKGVWGLKGLGILGGDTFSDAVVLSVCSPLLLFLGRPGAVGLYFF